MNLVVKEKVLLEEVRLDKRGYVISIGDKQKKALLKMMNKLIVLGLVDFDCTTDEKEDTAEIKVTYKYLDMDLVNIETSKYTPNQIRMAMGLEPIGGKPEESDMYEI